MKKRILITGKAHDVGYRPFLLGLAGSLEIGRFFADNIYINGEQAVEVLIDDLDRVSAFIELVKNKTPENAWVGRVEIKDYDGNVMKAESYYRYLTAMQLAKIATYGWRMLEKQDMMLEKQDETIKVIKEESKKTREEIGGKIDLLRSDLKDYIESNLKSIRQEISEIKQVLRKAGIM